MRTCHHEACYTTVTTVCVPTKVNCSLISVVPMHAWLSNVVRLSRCRDRRPRNRPVLRSRYRAAYRTARAPRNDAPRASRRAGPAPTPVAPAPARPRRPAWGVVATRLPAPGARLGESKRYVSLLGTLSRGDPFYKLYVFVCRSGPISFARHARAPRTEASLIHTLCS